MNSTREATICRHECARGAARRRLVMPNTPMGAKQDPTEKAKRSLAADGRSVVWTLKPGVKWHDGKPLTADDLVFTWDYARDPATAAVTARSLARSDPTSAIAASSSPVAVPTCTITSRTSESLWGSMASTPVLCETSPD